MSVVNPSLAELEAQREQLFEQLLAVGDFRPGSVSENYRRCGKANCACAQPEHPGHGPRLLWTRHDAGGKTVGRQLSVGEVAKVRREVEAYQRFTRISAQLARVSEAICEARPVGPPGAGLAGTSVDAGSDGEKRGSAAGSGTRSRRRSAPKSTG
jgi:hypothetical protein